jgi:hypothetical protein
MRGQRSSGGGAAAMAEFDRQFVGSSPTSKRGSKTPREAPGRAWLRRVLIPILSKSDSLAIERSRCRGIEAPCAPRLPRHPCILVADQPAWNGWTDVVR